MISVCVCAHTCVCLCLCVCVCVCVCVCMHSVTQVCLTLWDPLEAVTRLLCPWNFPSKNIGARCYFLLQKDYYKPMYNFGEHLSLDYFEFYHFLCKCLTQLLVPTIQMPEPHKGFTGKQNHQLISIMNR